MNVNNQSSTNLKQIRLQIPIPILESFANSLNELHKMYPAQEEANDEKQ